MLNEYFRVLGFIFSKPGILTIFILGPIIYPLIMGGVYYEGRTQNVPACIMDCDNSLMSRQYTSMLNQHQNIKLTEKANSVEEIRQAFEQHKVYFGIVIPRDFEKDIKRGRQTSILIYGDGMNLIPALIGYKGIRTVTGTFNAGIKINILTKKGLSKKAAYAKAMPLNTLTNNLYNPANNYITFILPALLCIVFMQITFMGISSVTYEKRSHKIDKVAGSYEGSYWLYGSFLAYLTLMIPMTVISSLLSYALFDFYVAGNVLMLFCVTVLFESVIIFLGIFLTNVFKDTMGVMICLMYISVPAFLIAGGSWPLEAMTPAVRTLCLYSPLTLYVTITRRLLIMGSNPWYVRELTFALMIWLIAAIAISRFSVHNIQKHTSQYIRRKQRIKESKQQNKS